MGKLTRSEQAMLELATRSPTGNPWFLVGVRSRSGGAKKRMFDRMKSAGLFDASNRITDAGRAALRPITQAGEMGK